MITSTHRQQVVDDLAALPGEPHTYSYEGQIGRKGYQGYHVHSVCSGPDMETETEKHHCIGAVIAKDEDTSRRLAHLVEASPYLLREVIRLRLVLEGLADEARMWENIEEAENCGGDGVRCAYMNVQSIARDALQER